MYEPTIPPIYWAVLAGATALYASVSVVLTQVLRMIWPIEGKAAMFVAGLVSVGFGLWAAVQRGLTTLPGLSPVEQIYAVLGLLGGVWWASQEIYRRLRVSTWPTKGNSAPAP